MKNHHHQQHFLFLFLCLKTCAWNLEMSFIRLNALVSKIVMRSFHGIFTLPLTFKGRRGPRHEWIETPIKTSWDITTSRTRPFFQLNVLSLLSFFVESLTLKRYAYLKDKGHIWLSIIRAYVMILSSHKSCTWSHHTLSHTTQVIHIQMKFVIHCLFFFYFTLNQDVLYFCIPLHYLTCKVDTPLTLTLEHVLKMCSFLPRHREWPHDYGSNKMYNKVMRMCVNFLWIKSDSMHLTTNLVMTWFRGWERDLRLRIERHNYCLTGQVDSGQRTRRRNCNVIGRISHEKDDSIIVSYSVVELVGNVMESMTWLECLKNEMEQ